MRKGSLKRSPMASITGRKRIVHEYFTPSANEIAYWKDLDRLAAEAEKAGTGPIIYGDPNRGEGHRVHIAHVGSARKNLVWAKELALA